MIRKTVTTLSAAAAVLAGSLVGLGTAAVTAAPAVHAATTVPHFDHVLVVIEENHAFNEIIGSSSAPYINGLAGQGAVFTQSFAVTHPSEPNYLELFSGSTQGLSDDSCPHSFSGPDLGGEAIAASVSFTGYSETMPSDGYTGCTSGAYARKHNPWVDFTDVPAASNRTFSAFPTDYTQLPRLGFVVPNLNDDMHDGTVQQGDTWLRNNIDGYAQWAKTHNSLLVVTWDEDDSSASNQIPTLMVGAGVTPGNYAETVTHDNVLRTVEDSFGLAPVGNSAGAAPITDVFGTGSGANTVSVTNPGSQTGTVGTAASLQISASDSAAGQTLSYSATGLPAGLSMNPATGLVSGTPTTAGTSTVQVTATDTTGASGSASFGWTVNPVVTGGGIVNGGFETGSFSGWTTTGTTSVVNSGAHSGGYAAQLGSTAPTNGNSTAAQTFTAPTGSSTLSFWYSVTCPDTVTYDWATVTLKDNTANTTKTVLAKTCVSSSGWKQVSTAVTAGHSYTLTLVSKDDNYAGDPTYTRYDDVTLA
ncbi:alkaline phosphatase family protein [Streptacidiphilus rugosus]|uniref:alkaline phosphatase family protein n=1 Tax=Streptacidiphilus rugosus TaxID=405783 RepID=UPI0007C6FDF8|nr:alkaline phosphatase family protein [Streptacidiphilus rugosus]